MRLLIFHWRDIKNPAGGGAENLLHDMLKNMAINGHEITMISSKFDGCEKEEIIDGIKVIRLGGKYSIYFYALVYYFWNLRNKMDLVIDSITGVPWFSPLYVKEPKIAIVYHLGKMKTFLNEFVGQNGFFGYFLAMLALMAEKTIPIIYKTSGFVTFSEDTRLDLVYSGVSERNIKVVQEGIDLSVYVQGNGKSEFPHIIYAGRLTKSKGIEFILKAMRIVVSRSPYAKLSIVGRGYYEKELKNLAKELCITQNVIFHGYISEREKIELMQKAHILVHSSMREGWATPIIEANACGTVAIGADVVGISNTIKDGVTGFLVPYGNENEIANKIIYLLNNGVQMKKMTNNALLWAKKFSKEEMASRFMEIISENYRRNLM